MVWGPISYNLRSHLVFLQGKVNSARYIAQIVNRVLLSFIWQEGDVLFQQDNAVVMQHALCDVQQLPWPARSPDLSPIEHMWDIMRREFTLFPEPATTIAELREWVQDAWHNLLQDGIRHLYDYLHARICTCPGKSVHCTLKEVFTWKMLYNIRMLTFFYRYCTSCFRT